MSTDHEKLLPDGVQAILKAGTPDWRRIGFDVRCARCGYNLRTLAVPRCPECGLKFTWGAALDTSSRESEVLFEHRFLDRPIRSWLATVWKSLRPCRFWASLSIHQRIAPLALWVLLASSIVVFLITLHVAAGVVFVAARIANMLDPMAVGGAVWSGPNVPARVQLERIAGDLSILPVRIGWRYFWVPGGAAIMILTVLLVLSGLRQTRGGHHVRAVQVLRVVAYAANPVAIVAALMLVASTLISGIVAPGSIVNAALSYGVPLLLVAIPGTYLSIALRDYLQLPRPFALAYVAAIVGFLLLVTSYMASSI